MADVTEGVEEGVEKIKETAGSNGGGFAKKLVAPAAAGLGTIVVSYAAKKGPELMRDKVLPLLEQKGEQEAENMGRSAAKGAGEALPGGGLLGKAAEKLTGGGGGGSGGEDVRGWGKGRRLPLQHSIDVAVPIEAAYEAWTDFEQLPEFMHRVEQVEREDDDTVVWHENIWGIRRDWKAEIIKERKNQVLAWRSSSRGGNTGVLTFHRLAPRLTRLEVTFDFQPQGLFEKLSSGLRFHKRAAKSDLRRFKAYVETKENADEELRPASEADAGDDAGDESEADEPQARGRDDDSDAERERKEREQRREERRKASKS